MRSQGEGLVWIGMGRARVTVVMEWVWLKSMGVWLGKV